MCKRRRRRYQTTSTTLSNDVDDAIKSQSPLSKFVENRFTTFLTISTSVAATYFCQKKKEIGPNLQGVDLVKAI